MPDHSDIIISPELYIRIVDEVKHTPILYISGIVGCGKTAVVQKIFANYRYTYLALSEALTLEIPQTAKLVLIDDLHLLFFHPEMQDTLRELLLHAPKSRHFVLMSRAPLPNYLLSFAIDGTLRQLKAADFAFDIDMFSRMLKAYSISLDEADMRRILDVSRGYALFLRLICVTLAEAPIPVETPIQSLIQKTFDRLFSYLDNRLYNTWSDETHKFLLSISLFDPLPAELLPALCGEDAAAHALQVVTHTTNFLQEKDGFFTFQLPRMRPYLQRKMTQLFDHAALRQLYQRGAQWYEENGYTPQAIEYYAKINDHTSLVRALTANALQHPGIGSYNHSTMQYYALLTEEEIVSSPALISAMSMICSIECEAERSEHWYRVLKNQLQTMDRRTPEYKRTRSWLLYLDIALPHRGSAGLDQLLPAIYMRKSAQDIQLPTLSVTSNLPSLLNGGKDFSSWVPRDTLLYQLLSRPVELLLGRMGVGLPPLALAESQYEKGEDISGRFVELMSLRPTLQQKGTPEMEFVLVGLRTYVLRDQGAWQQAVSDLRQFRADMKQRGATQLLPNIDALLCRLCLLHNDAFADTWRKEQAPAEQPFVTMDRYRYLTKVRCLLQQQQYFQALTLLGKLLSYFEQYHRTLNQIETLILLAICRFRMKAADWTDYLSRALRLGQQYGYVTVFASEGIALLPLLHALPWQENDTYFRRITDATQRQSLLYPKYLAANLGEIPHLNNMERKVLRLICNNKSNTEISNILNISPNTLKTHIRHLFAKLGAKNRNEAREIAHRLRLDEVI